MESDGIMKKKKSNLEVGVAWYKPEQWALLRAYAEDSDTLENTYPEWLEIAKQSYKDLEQQGLNLTKVEVDVDSLVEWCKEKNIPLNGAARSRYAKELLEENNK